MCGTEKIREEIERDMLIAARRGRRGGLSFAELWAVYSSVDEALRADEARIREARGKDEAAWRSECQALANEDGC